MVAATGLSAGTLIATAVVNPKVAYELMRTELVMAEDTNENKKSVNEAIPDRALRASIARKLGRHSLFAPDELTWDDLNREELSKLVLVGKSHSSLEGIEYIKELKELWIEYTSIKDISILSKVSNLETLVMEANNVTNFDVLSEINGSKIVNGKVDVREHSLPVYMKEAKTDEMILDLSSYVGNIVNNKIRNLEVIINEESVNSSYDPETGMITIKDLVNRSNKDDNGNYSGEVTIELNQRPSITGGTAFIFGINTTIVQPYTIVETVPTITANDVEINIGGEWGKYANLESATDEFNREIPTNEIEVTGDENVNIQEEGTYPITYSYRYKGDSKISKTVNVIVNDTSNPDPTDPPDVTDPPDPGGEKPNIEKIPKTDIMTNKPTLDIYNSEGTKTGTKKLTDEITDFTTEKENNLNSGKYYQIGDNEWVSAKDVAVFEYTDSYIQTHGSKVKNLTDFGNKGTLTDRALDKSSSWYTDRSAYFDGEWHHRVSTHEWVHDDNVVQYEIASGVVHATETATLYNSKGKKVTDRALAKGSTFFTDRKATIDGKLMHRVSTDEWVDADTVTFK